MIPFYDMLPCVGDIFSVVLNQKSYKTFTGQIGTSMELTPVRQAGIPAHSSAFHIVASHNQTNEISAKLSKNMKQIDPQDGRSLAVECHHFAYSFL